jgi:hypothetical protein
MAMSCFSPQKKILPIPRTLSSLCFHEYVISMAIFVKMIYFYIVQSHARI